jgi:WD40 repeat protein
MTTFTGHTDWVRSVVFTPDGKTLIVWDMATGNARSTFHAGARNIYGVAFSPNGKLLASAEWEGIVRLWDTKTGKDTGASITESRCCRWRSHLTGS